MGLGMWGEEFSMGRNQWHTANEITLTDAPTRTSRKHPEQAPTECKKKIIRKYDGEKQNNLTRKQRRRTILIEYVWLMYKQWLLHCM